MKGSSVYGNYSEKGVAHVGFTRAPTVDDVGLLKKYGCVWYLYRGRGTHMS